MSSDPRFDLGNKPDDTMFAPEPPARQPRGCWFYGCVTAAVLALLALIATGIMVYVGVSYYNRMINTYTATAPDKIPVVTFPEDRLKELDGRYNDFKSALDKGEARTIVLTADELNAKVEENPKLKGKVFFSINDDTLTAQVSVPGSDLGLPGLSGRYLNGKATLGVSITDGELVVIARDLEVNGKSLPSELKSQLSSKNLAENFKDDSEGAGNIRNVESLVIKGGTITITSKARTKAEAEPKADEPAKPENGDTPKPDVKTEGPAVETPAPPADTPKKDETPKKEETPEPSTPKAAA